MLGVVVVGVGVPQRVDDVGARVLATRLADERAGPHLAQRGAQVLDVRCLVGLDGPNDLGGRTITSHEVDVGEDLLGPAEDVKGLDLHEQDPQHGGDQQDGGHGVVGRYFFTTAKLNF